MSERKDRDISTTDIQIGLRLLDRKQTTVNYDETDKILRIEIDLSELIECVKKK